MKSIYLHSATAISAQDTFGEDFVSPIEVVGDKVHAIHPSYRDYITPVAARRMAPVVKMGVAAAKKALQNANLRTPDAIITGSGMGCMQDTEKFLNALIENNEAYLSPTPFIQSTHNTVGAQIALELGCNAYNNTFVHGSLSFESAMIDAQLYLSENATAEVLVGGVDELGTEFVDYVRQIEDADSNGIKVPLSEGATFFMLSNEKKESKVLLKGIQTFRIVEEVDIYSKTVQFLKDVNLKTSDIDTLFLGNNVDSFDSYYNEVSSSFPKIEIQQFKKLSGEYHTASAFAVWLAYQKLTSEESTNHILIYNQFKGKNHSFLLLSKH